jgi:hypothetical protein
MRIGNEAYFGKAQRFAHFKRESQMPIVDRIEGAAEDTDRRTQRRGP